MRPDALVVIATGHVQDKDVARARAAGVHEVIQKPSNLEEMAQTTRRTRAARAPAAGYVIGMCRGCAATRPIHASTLGYGERSSPASGATCVYAYSAMSAIE